MLFQNPITWERKTLKVSYEKQKQKHIKTMGMQLSSDS